MGRSFKHVARPLNPAQRRAALERVDPNLERIDPKVRPRSPLFPSDQSLASTIPSALPLTSVTRKSQSSPSLPALPGASRALDLGSAGPRGTDPLRLGDRVIIAGCGRREDLN